jgi:hypothetical protein
MRSWAAFDPPQRDQDFEFSVGKELLLTIKMVRTVEQE